MTKISELHPEKIDSEGVIKNNEPINRNLQVRDYNNPEDVMKFAMVLKEFIKKNELSCEIQGKNYVFVDGWKFAGVNFGIVPMVQKPVKDKEEKTYYVFYKKKKYKDDKGQWKEADMPDVVMPFETGKTITEEDRKNMGFTRYSMVPAYKYECECELIRANDQVKIGYGFAMCTNAEMKKVKFDEYAIASMVQTRAIGKAYKNILGFIMSAAGFETTPAEEMEEKYTKEEAKTKEEALRDFKTALDLEVTHLEQIEEFWGRWEELHKDKDAIIAIQKHKIKLIEANKKQKP